MAGNPDDSGLAGQSESLRSQIAIHFEDFDYTYKALISLTLSGILLPEKSEDNLDNVNKDFDTATAESSVEDQGGRARIESRMFVDAVALYLLPLIYGLLGANVYILRHLLAKLDGWGLNTGMKSKHRLRRPLGAPLGSTVGLIFSGGESDLEAAGFSLALFAFLAGYSAEFIFSVLDMMIEKARNIVAGNRQTTSQPRSDGVPPNA